MVDLGAIAHRTKCETVNLLVLLERITCKLDADVAEHTRIVGVVITAVLGARATLNLLLLLVVESLTADDDTTPVAWLAATCSLFRCENDRFGGSTLCEEFTAALHDERCLCLLVALDHCTRFDGQFSAIGDIYPSLKNIGAFL